MHPAPSIIAFTVLSGLGFGLLGFLGLGKPDVSGFTAFVFFFIGFGLAISGLISSTFHLGNPQRALKAFSQWRTSWLSREGWLSVATLIVMGIYAIGIIFFHTRFAILGILGALLCLATVFATSMIYTQIKTVPRWNHWSTPVLFLLYSITGGALLSGQVWIAEPLFLLLGAAQLVFWMFGDNLFADSGSNMGTATGLGSLGKVRLFEGPHSGGNYLTREMVHVVGRKHAVKLRVISVFCLALLPWAIFTFFNFGHAWALLAVILHLIGAFVSRWLFFAQAEHTVGLYYGAR